MKLRMELEPHFERITGTIIERRDNPSKYPGSSTLRLLAEGWVSPAKQEVKTDGKLTKPFGIGDKLGEEAVEVAQSAFMDKDNKILESSQALYYVAVGMVVENIKPQEVFNTVEVVAKEQAFAVIPQDKLAEHAGAALVRVALAGAIGNRELLLQRSAEAIIGLNRFWEANGISPSEVGKQI